MSGINKFIVQVPKNPQDIAAVWGRITGTITNQTDLVTYIGTRLADYVPYTGATSNVNLGIYNLKTSQVSLGTTATDGFILENSTAATAGATVQISPRNRWRGTALATGVNTSQTFDFTAETLPISQATNIDGEFRIRSSRNGAAYVERFGVKTEGNDTKLKVGGVNYFGKAGNQNDFYSGTTSLRFIKNDASIIYMTISNTDGTTTLSPSTLTGSAATAALSMTQTWNTSGAPDLITANVTNTASDVLSNLINLKVNTLSKFKITRRGVMTLADDVINPSFNITGVSGNTMAFAADSAGGYVGSVNSIPFRILVRNGVFTPAVFGTNGDVGLGGNISNFTTLAGAVVKVLAAGTGSLTGGTISGSATTPFWDITGTWNTSGVVDGAIRLDVVQTAVGTNAKLMNLKVGGNSKASFVTNTGGTETTLRLNDNTVIAQGSGTTQFYASSSGFTWYDSSGGTGLFKGTNAGVFAMGFNLTNSALPYRFALGGNGEAVSMLVQSSHTTPIPYYETRTSRGSVSSPTATQSGDVVGGLLMGGRGTTVWNNQGAAITAIANQTFTDANGGTYLKFQTTANGSVTRQDVLFLGANALVQFAGQTSSFPALKRSSAALQARLADDSAYAQFDALGYSVGGAAGATGSFTTADLKTVTVTNGIITAIV